MYTLQACSVPTGTTYDPYGSLRRSAASRARVDAATNKAAASYDRLLCRNPADFLKFGLTVAKDVAAVNEATDCSPGGTPAAVNVIPGGAAGGSTVGDGEAAGALAAMLSALGITPNPPAGSPNGASAAGSPRGSWRGQLRGGGARGGQGGDCDIAGGVNVQPLNASSVSGPVSAMPQVSAAPAKLTTGGLLPSGGGIGRYRRGLGSCTEFPDWGDAFPNGGPSASVGSDILSWIQQNPWLTAGIVLGGGWLLFGGGGKRG
jgi:hypothetical protein